MLAGKLLTKSERERVLYPTHMAFSWQWLDFATGTGELVDPMEGESKVRSSSFNKGSREGGSGSSPSPLVREIGLGQANH